MEYDIVGNNMQALHVTLGEGERIYADSGKLVSKSDNVVMTPRMVGGVINAIERKITGASGLLTVFESRDGTGDVQVAGVIPGKIIQLDLKPGDSFIAEDHAFLAAQESVKFTIQAVSLGPAFFGGAGIVLQKFEGPGAVFLHVSGDVIEYNLDGSHAFEIDPSHIAGFESTLSYKIRFVDNVRTAMFGGVGLFLATFTGKGRVLAHSVSRLKLSSEIYAEGLRQNSHK